MSLRERATKLNSGNGVPFMEGREKAETLPLNSPVTIDNYGFIDGEGGEYVVLSLKEFPKHFFFGGSVVTDKMQELNEGITEEELNEVHTVGVPVIFSKRNSKKGRKEYTTCEFYPNVDME